MPQHKPRKFTLEKAKREQVPVLVGLAGPSGCGKTFSALRIAKGIQSVVGGKIAVIDTEGRRALHYADYFDFDYIELKPPFGSLDYRDAIRYAVKEAGCTVVVIDSMSHEHEGPGGLLDSFEAELDRLARGDANRRERVKMLAWQKPKADRRALLLELVQSKAHFVLCFRAKSTAKPMQKTVDRQKKTVVEDMGYLPITGEEFPFEMTLNILLPPACGGVPDWQPEHRGERQMMKLPEQFKAYFLERGRKPLDEAVGRHLAEWARGGEFAPAPSAPRPRQGSGPAPEGEAKAPKGKPKAPVEAGAGPKPGGCPARYDHDDGRISRCKIPRTHEGPHVWGEPEDPPETQQGLR